MNRLEIPDFLQLTETVSKKENSELTLEIPTFEDNTLPEAIDKSAESLLELPTFFPPPLPIINETSPLAIHLPDFLPFQSPKLRASIDPTLDLPHFPTPPLPIPKKDFTPTLAVHNYLPFPLPQLKEPIKHAITLPEFFNASVPLPKEPSPCSLETPNYLPFLLPKIQKPRQKSLKLPTNKIENHPVVKLFDYLSKSKSYDAIFQEAIKADSLGDIRMLKRHSLLARYLNNQFDRTIEEATSILPESDSFKFLLENDQEQLNLLAQFCAHLMEIDRWEDLKVPPNTFLEKILSSKHLPDEAIYRKRLLQFKDSIYSFVSEILVQEQNAALRFGTPKKDLSSLQEILSLFSIHIQSQAQALRMRMIRTASDLDFSKWEDRTPVATTATKLENRGKEVTIQGLQKGLADIHKEKPAVYQLQDFTDQVLSLPESDENEASTKANYLLELGKVYLKLPTISALKRSLSWTDLAIMTLSEHVAKDHPLLLTCYEIRGTIWLSIAEQLKNRGNNEVSLIRKRIDASYKDFHYSYPLLESQERNFVRWAQLAKEHNLDFKESVKVDDDYAEARYLDFLRQFEKLQLDSERVLHPSFENLKQVPPTETLNTLKTILLKKGHQKNGSLFKVTLTSGTSYLKIDAQGLHISRSGTNFLIDMLTNGIKKVKIVDSQKKKIYFCSPILKERIIEIVQDVGDYQKRLKEIEQGIHTFHAFELAAFYKSSLLDVNEEINIDTIRKRLNPNLISRVIHLNIMAMNQSKDSSLLYACHAIRDCERMANHSETKLELLIKRANIYKQLGLKNCQANDLEEAIAYGKKIHSVFLNPSLHFTLGCVYLELNRKEEAKEQFYIVRSCQNKDISKKAEKKLGELQKEIEPIVQDEVAILTKFQDQNIREECLQFIRDHFHANSKIHPHRNVPLWETFIQRINQTKTIKEFCETILSSLLISQKVTAENINRIATLANLPVKNLESIKAYVLDALKAYQEEEARLQDEAINKLDAAKAAVARAEAFLKFKTLLKNKLKEGERIRPGSPIRQKIVDLSSHLGGIEMDRAHILRTLADIIGEGISPDLEIVEEEIVEILENALEIEIKPPKVQENVLHIYGQNIFLSQIKETIKKCLAKDQTIHDIHIMGIHVYVDTNIEWPGINLAIGGQYVECLLNKGKSGRKDPTRLKINLSGKDGVNGPQLNMGPAANGNNPCDDGSDGRAGNDGDGGQPGGDLCVSTIDPIVGFNDTIIEQISLLGGAGGIGSKGQAGGKGARGVKGTDARTSIQDGDPADSMWGHVDIRRGGKGRPAGFGGRGGDGGVGGKGGLSGRLLLENIENPLNDQIKQGNGKDGANGEPGEGGKGGEGEPDGFDYVIVKGGLFHGQHKISGYELYCKGKDREKESWVDGISREKTITRNQGREKGRGKTAEEQARSRRQQAKHDLKRELFSANLARHIHTEAAGNKAYAFNEVTDRLAVAHENEEVAQEQVTIRQKKMKDIEALHQTSAMLLNQAQTVQEAQTQHSRVATFHAVDKRVNLNKEIEVFFKNQEKDKENILPFHECSPIFHEEGKLIIHDVEIAMHEVNVTHAQNIPAITKLISSLQQAKDNFISEKKTLLLNKLVKIIQEIPLKFAVQGFSLLKNACKDLQEGDALKNAILEKEIQVDLFQKIVDEEKNFLSQAYQTKIQDNIVKGAILKFIHRDRLFFCLITKKFNELERAKKERWFEKRLYHKVISLLFQITKAEPSQNVIDEYFQFGKKIQSKEICLAERKEVQGQLKTLRHDQDWLLEHLNELCDSKISPKKYLEDGLKIEDVYIECSKQWTNIPSFPPENEVSLIPLIQEEVTPLTQWMNEVRKEDWEPQKILELERNVKQLVDLKEDLKNIQPYLNQLKKLYAEDPDLVEVFMSLVCCYKEMSPCQIILNQIKTEEIFHLRKEYWTLLEDPDQQIQELSKKVYIYLQNKHILLIKNECIEFLLHKSPDLSEKKKEINALLNEFLLKANRLYWTQNFYPDVDFLFLAKEVITETNDLEINLFDLLLKKVVGEQIENVDLEALNEKDIKKFRASLFLLANKDLSYSKTLKLINILSESQTQNQALAFFIKKADEQKIKFEFQWHGVLERAKLYDRLREQVQKENHHSVERLLHQIAAEADLLSADEKIEILSQIIAIISNEGCFSSVPKLISLQNQLISKWARFSTIENCILDYHEALDAENIKVLPDLFMEVIEKMAFNENFLIPSLIAVNHFPFTANQLITLYKKIYSLDECEFKQNCLNTIRKFLVESLEKDYGALSKKQADLKTSLLKEQNDFLTQITDIIKSSQLLYPDRHIAKIELWLKTLDSHFEIASKNDSDGNQRKILYKEALDRFFNVIKAQDLEGAMGHFHSWLREKINSLNGCVADINTLKNLFSNLEEAKPVLKKTYWRGIIPYTPAENEQSVFDLLEGKQLNDEMATLIKLKFDESMIQEECYEIRQELQKHQQKENEKFAGWINHIKTQLCSDQISDIQLVEMFPIDGIPLDFEPTPKENPPVEVVNPQILIEFIEDLERRLAKGEIDKEDSISLNNMKKLFKDERLDQLELKLIEFNDHKNERKKVLIQNFLDRLCAINSINQLSLTDLFSPQILKNIDQLKNALSSCEALDEEQFLILLNKLNNFVKNYDGPINIQMLANIFWVFPRLNDLEQIDEIIEKRLPENWAMVLLEKLCLETITSLLSRKSLELPDLNLSHMTDGQKDEFIHHALKENEKNCQNCFNSFKNALTRLISSQRLTSRDKELLLRLIVDRLMMLNQGRLGFSIEGFVQLIDEYMTSPCVLKKLSSELSNPNSVIANNLFQPSFESFKYSLSLAWIKGMLEPPLLSINPADRQKLFASLFEIETIKKEETMKEVVVSLQGGLMTPAVVECVLQFAQGSLELDKETLTLLKNRTANGEWYNDIVKYTKEKRLKPRDLKKLVSKMAEEMNGINSSIKDLLIGDKPQLITDIEEIKAEFEKVKNWNAEEITAWAINNRGEHFREDPTLIKKGIAVVSRATQIMDKHSLRDTQLIALWLMFRKKSGPKKGRIGQMFTGEGKSITFACIDVLDAMSKSHMDNTTSSPVLAEREPPSKKILFELFGMSVTNNCDLECEADEEIRKKRYFQNGKPVDVVFGDVGAFERDLLLTEFHGKEIIHESRLGENRSVSVDEVDGLFLDNAGMVLYLSHNVDTLRFVERIFAQIWTLANHPSFERASPFDDKAVEAISKMMKGKLESGEIPLPKYELTQARYMEMKAVIERKLPIWIRSSIYAKGLRVNNEYIITDQMVGGKKKKSITVMDKGTGVEQFSLKWSNGLHQFLQLKHGLELSPESLKAVFLSNYFFFKRYGSRIYGLSGTLGSDTEQKYLEDLYQVELFKIPRFKEERFIQYKPTVVGDVDEWFSAIEMSLERQVKERKRAALIICESVEEVMILKERLKVQYPSLHIYTSSSQELSFLSQDRPVGPGDVIIATNLAGRGTDLKTLPILEAHGGLHVILSYLPSNIRIQMQGLGRTGRSGNEGSGEIITIDPRRLPFTELCRLRDLAEKQRLESVAIKEVKKIEFENELLRGFNYKGESIAGFQSILNSIKEALKGEPPFYREAQLNSLKNRWSFWIDHMDEKISMVYALGKENVVASFKKFHEGVLADFHGGSFRLIKEPAELIKLGGEYRQKEMWSEAANCYAEAGKDPHYAYALYYKAACELIKSPSSSLSAKLNFKADAKKAALAIKSEISQLQTSIQNITPLVEQQRLKAGDADFGNPYKVRSEERIQIWSIFLSAIDSAVGGTLSEDKLKNNPFVKGSEATKILDILGDNYKPTRLSKKLTFGDKITYKGKDLPVPKMFNPVVRSLNGIRKIDKPALKIHCNGMVTQESAKRVLNCPSIVTYKLSSIPPSFEGWPAGYSEPIKFVLSTIVEECKYETFDSHDAIKGKFAEKINGHPILNTINANQFFESLVTGKLVLEDYKINLAGKIVKAGDLKFDSLKQIKDGFTDDYKNLPEELQEAVVNACREREQTENGVSWSLKSAIYLSDLSLPKTTDEASEILWTFLEERQVIKPAKIKMVHHEYKRQAERIKDDLKNFFRGNEKLDEAVDSIFEIIDGSIGMIYKLDDKKTTAKFADIIRKYFHDHRQHAPEGLGFFIELGLEVIADLIEKKDPPAWFEVLAITVMGVVQMVAGVIIKAYLPVVGELIGNALMNTGMDDVMFAITSAVSGEFSWEDYGAAKVQSMKRAIISSAITCGVSFGANAIQLGSVDKAWKVQKLSGVDKAMKAGKLVQGSFNLGTHILKEVGRNFLTMGISQLASRGLEGMTKLISSSYERKISEGIEKAVNDHWHLVTTQAQALYDKLGGDPSVQGNMQGCIDQSMKKVRESNFFDGAIRTSKQVLPQASSLIGNNGWSTFISHAPDLANLGVSIPKLINLVDDSVHQLAREVRETKDRKESISPANKMSKEAFDGQLENMKRQYIEQLTSAFNGVLNGAVYAPLVSMGTQYLVEKGKELCVPLTEQEKLAQSALHLSKILETENNVDNAFYDEALRKWKDVNDEVTILSNEDLKKTPLNAEETIETLKMQYGDLLKIYKDNEGNLYAQRPTRKEYAQGILEGKASSDPEIVALTKIVGKNIAMTTPEGKIKTYLQDGTIVLSDPGVKNENTIYLKVDHSQDSGIGHVTVEGASNPTNLSYTGLNCLYEAVIQAAHLTENSQQLRLITSERLSHDDHCKRFYHQWSLSSEPKQFVGKESWKLGTRLYGGLQAVGGLSESTLGGYLTFVTGGTGAAAGIPLMLHGYDNFKAGIETLYTGEIVDSEVTKLLMKEFGLSHSTAQMTNDLIGLVGTGGAGLLYNRSVVTSTIRFSEITIADLAKTKTSVDNALKIGNFKYTNTAGRHFNDIVKRGPYKGEFSRPYMNSPHTINEIMAGGKPIPDPGGIPGGLRWDVPGIFRNRVGTWELVLHPENKVIYHFNFK